MDFQFKVLICVEFKDTNYNTHMEIIIRPLIASDWQSVSNIYQQGIDTGYATFQPQIPTWEEWDASRYQYCRFVAVTASTGIVLGWIAIAPFSPRKVYEGVAIQSVYVSNEARGLGIGKILLKHLITESEKHSIWTLQADILGDNVASIKLHEKCGFRLAGFREKLGNLNGKWTDIRLYERRSKMVGALENEEMNRMNADYFQLLV